jgi:hypothetical protein
MKQFFIAIHVMKIRLNDGVRKQALGRHKVGDLSDIV